MRLFVEIERTAAGYAGAAHGLAPRPCPLADLKLGPDARLEIRDKERSLDELWQVLVDFDRDELTASFNERGQLQLGTYLFDQVFRAKTILERDRQTLLAGEDVEVRIVTSDEHILRLPWNLLCADGIFLSPQGWSVTLAGSKESASVELPTLPRLLIAVPSPSGGFRPTGAEQHLQELMRLLKQGPPDYWDNYVSTVTTWADFKDQVARFKPHLVYFYGHGVGDRDSSKLVFEGRRPRARPVSMIELGQCLGALDRPPRLVYLNSCSGDAGGLLGAGNQLRRWVPAVIANRTAAWAGASRVLALEFFEGLLLDGAEPHAAIARTHERLYDLDNIEVKDPRWMTPVLHASYEEWRHKPLRREREPAAEPYAEERLDRTRQMGEITQPARSMLQRRRPACQAFVWHGAEGQGVELFHDYLVSELKQWREVDHLRQLRLAWPDELFSLRLSFEAMLNEVFHVENLDDIPTSLRTELASPLHDQTSVYYLRLPPVSVPRSPSSSPVNLKAVAAFLRFLEARVSRHVQPPCFAVIGVALRIEDPASLGTRLEQLEQTSQDRFRVKLLRDELVSVKEHEIKDYLQRRYPGILPDNQPRVAAEIHRRTGGRYETTLEELGRAEDIVFELEDWATTGT